MAVERFLTICGRDGRKGCTERLRPLPTGRGSGKFHPHPVLCRGREDCHGESHEDSHGDFQGQALWPGARLEDPGKTDRFSAKVFFRRSDTPEQLIETLRSKRIKQITKLPLTESPALDPTSHVEAPTTTRSEWGLRPISRRPGAGSIHRPPSRMPQPNPPEPGPTTTSRSPPYPAFPSHRDTRPGCSWRKTRK